MRTCFDKARWSHRALSLVGWYTFFFFLLSANSPVWEPAESAIKRAERNERSDAHATLGCLFSFSCELGCWYAIHISIVLRTKNVGATQAKTKEQRTRKRYFLIFVTSSSIPVSLASLQTETHSTAREHEPIRRSVSRFAPFVIWCEHSNQEIQ